MFRRIRNIAIAAALVFAGGHVALPTSWFLLPKERQVRVPEKQLLQGPVIELRGATSLLPSASALQLQATIRVAPCLDFQKAILVQMGAGRWAEARPCKVQGRQLHSPGGARARRMRALPSGCCCSTARAVLLCADAGQNPRLFDASGQAAANALVKLLGQ